MSAKPIIAALLTAAIALLLLSGCGNRVVSVPCVEAGSLPPETQRPTLTGNAPSDVMILLNSLLLMRNEVGDLRAIVSGCVG